MEKAQQQPVVAVLLGDATGVGPELVAKLAAKGTFQQHFRPLLIGDARVLELGCRQAGVQVDYRTVEDVVHIDWADPALPLLDMKDVDPVAVPIGKVDAVSGKSCVEMLGKSVELYRKGVIDGVCYAPLNKTAMHEGGNPAASELELLALLLGHQGPCGEINTLDGVWTTRVTSHVPLMEVGKHLTTEEILGSARLANRSLINAGVTYPKIAVAALNPHCGENGLCGREEIEIIQPAVSLARQEGIDASGPYSADVLFVKAFAGEYDAVVTMFHDQGQIALKLRGFERGITICGGLELPATTCGHGTAHDIAGKGIAATTSFENAVAMAGRMAAHTGGYDHLHG